ncbi:MAG: hypothetical protein IJI75_03380 [Solobacterium sp.]|nr:hypothetical protein [Solobacterium sp.]
MTNEKEEAKIGRPLANIDRTQFENLCKLQCTQEEICGWFGVSDKTLTRWCKREYGKPWKEVYAEKREAGKVSLRRAQWKMAEKNANMAIWLGKQYLGQKNKLEVQRQDEPENDWDEYM